MSGNNYPADVIQSPQLNDINIGFKTAEDVPFIFVAYSHGTDQALHSAGETYLSTNINQTSFNRAFFYTVSCHAASSLGDCLIDNGCYSFFGYKSPFNFWVGYRSFSLCANLGFFLFIQGHNSDNIYDSMVEEYNNHIDDLYLKNSLIASLLVENRDALVYKGHGITIHDLAQ